MLNRGFAGKRDADRTAVQAANDAAQQMLSYFAGLLDRRTAAPADDVITAPSRSNRPRRETTPPAPGPATRRAADPELPAGRIAHDRTNVIHPVRAVQGRSGRSTAAAKGRPLPYP